SSVAITSTGDRGPRDQAECPFGCRVPASPDLPDGGTSYGLGRLTRLYYRVLAAGDDAPAVIRDSAWHAGRLAATEQLTLDCAAGWLLDAAKLPVGVGMAAILVGEGLRAGLAAPAEGAGR